MKNLLSFPKIFFTFIISVKEDFLIGERIPVISVPSGYTTGCVTIRILSSAVVERVEDIHIAISNTTLAEVVGNTITTVYIVDTGGMHIAIYIHRCVQRVLIVFSSCVSRI